METTQTGGDELDFVVSAGHNEYALPDAISEVVWDPCDVSVVSLIEDAEDSAAEARCLYLDRHLPDIDADVEWETVVRVRAPRAVVSDALDAFLAELAGGPYGGDDDTFDYWPSGVRLAQGVAKVLDREQDVEKVVDASLAAKGLDRVDVGL